MEHRDLSHGAARAFLLLACISIAAAHSAFAGTGDLDPSFADHGRLGEIPGVVGTARSIELLDDGFLVGGGYFALWHNPPEMPRTPCSRRVVNFFSLVQENGVVDSTLASASVPSIEAFDMERLADGRILATGRRIIGPASSCVVSSRLVVFRLATDGSLDPEFGVDGVFDADLEASSLGLSLALEPDGRIVVAGQGVVTVGDVTEIRMLVLRLLPDGQLDPAFSESGTYVDVVANSAGDILRTPSGAYRTVAAVAGGCAVIGLTPNGERDIAFGDGGIRTVTSDDGLPASCSSLAVTANGQKLLVAGATHGGALVARLLANGASDPTFQADPIIADSMASATAIESVAQGEVLVAGVGAEGASIVRLQASGARQPAFGNDGLTWIDLVMDYSLTPTINDMAVRNDGSVTAVGGYGLPFIVQLIGNSGAAGPGILSLVSDAASARESEREVSLKVRRRGGSDGAVSARYRAFADSGATANEDFTAETGTLHWADGDTSEREIVVKIADDQGSAEGAETFLVALEEANGGAGIGLRTSTVEIQPDGAPGGQIGFHGYGSPIREGRTVVVLLGREFYSEGRVCVTLTARSGSATAGADFEETRSVHCWEDQDVKVKRVEIPTLNDSDGEPAETFTIKLSNATGGAIVGWLDSVEITIASSDQPVTPPTPSPNNNNAAGGGGSVGILELLLMLGGFVSYRARRSVLVGFAFVALPALAATGDLDPEFASHGRLAPIADTAGAAMFVESVDSGGILVGGSDFDFSGSLFNLDGMGCSYRAHGSSFVRAINERGVVDPMVDPAMVTGIEAVDMARQADGKIIGIGHKIQLISSFRCSHSFTPTVFRLNSDGSLDAAFAQNGMRELPRIRSVRSLALDSKGRIVLAGTRWVDDNDPATPGRHELAVMRLRPAGNVDRSFGTDGFSFGPVSDAKLSPYFRSGYEGTDKISLVRIGADALRIAVQSRGVCTVVGLTADGMPDAAFGTAGIAIPRTEGDARLNCQTLKSAADGRLVVAGSARNRGFVGRLLANGEPDTAFTVDPEIARSMSRVTSVATAADGKLLVAGTGPRGTSVVRLQAGGSLDPAFGDSGRTWIDLDTELGPAPTVHDMTVREDGTVIAVGRDVYTDSPFANADTPFVVQLLGDGGGLSRGILSFTKSTTALQQSAGKAILRVRRSGGGDGIVSARFRTLADLEASEHEDFVPKAGRLHWAVGDRSEKAIVIDIPEGDTAPEYLESFRVVLEDVRGGAGIGRRWATVDIQPDGFPGGQIEILADNGVEASENGFGQVWLRRNLYFEGRVCATVTVRSGSAIAGEDFRSNPTTVCWDDQEYEDDKFVDFRIIDDDLEEGIETFTVNLSNPTGGAILGPSSSTTVTLHDND